MQIPLVMTLIGRDRPGLVGRIADVVAVHGGNWLESRMCHLGGEFAGILRVHVSQEKQDALLRALRVLEADGLSLTVRPDSTSSQSPALSAAAASLELIGQDRPGIVRQISGALARYGVNVEELETECCSAPMSGETLFKAKIKLHIPQNCPWNSLREELEQIAADLMVELTISPGEPAQAAD
jgi:glycine cleavage system regulatory protein